MTTLAGIELADGRARILVGDVRERLRDLAAGSVHCVVTSPPYWGLRDYGTGAWTGGDPSHAHDTKGARGGRGGSGTLDKRSANAMPAALAVDACSCGARRVDQQLGLEATPDEYVAAMVDVFREVRRVLRDDGTVWLNLGDSYASHDPGGPREGEFLNSGGRPPVKGQARLRSGNYRPGGLKPKDLVGIPWRVAFALQADGWWLRSSIVWSKLNPMPESVTDRPTTAHEYVFLLAKSARYYYDADAVREPYKYDGRKVTTVEGRDGSHQHRNGERWPGIGKAHHAARAATTGHGHDESEPMEIGHAGRNLRSVWTIATEPYPDAHFATFPTALVEPCVKAGTSEHGVCPECGAPWERETERHAGVAEAHERPKQTRGMHSGTSTLGLSGNGSREWAERGTKTHTTGWRATCECLCTRGGDFGAVLAIDQPWTPVPATVLDPFLGSGTTAVVALRLGRNAIGVDLSAEYAALAEKRLARWWEKPARAPDSPADQLDLITFLDGGYA